MSPRSVHSQHCRRTGRLVEAPRAKLRPEAGQPGVSLTAVNHANVRVSGGSKGTGSGNRRQELKGSRFIDALASMMCTSDRHQFELSVRASRVFPMPTYGQVTARGHAPPVPPHPGRNGFTGLPNAHRALPVRLGAPIQNKFTLARYGAFSVRLWNNELLCPKGSDSEATGSAAATTSSPLLTAIKGARKSIDILIFRMDWKELEKALTEASGRGVAVRALIANTNRNGEPRLRSLETRFLAAGVIVGRTASDLIRYHGKMMIVDRQTLFLLSFNFVHIDIEHSHLIRRSSPKARGSYGRP